jgi:hypothetical protein
MVRSDFGALADDETGGSALRVVPHVKFGWAMAGIVGAHPRQWSHYNPVAQFKTPHLNWSNEWL